MEVTSIVSGREYDAGPLAEGSDAERDRIRDLYPVKEPETGAAKDEDEESVDEEEVKKDDAASAGHEEEETGEFYVVDEDVSAVDLRSMESSTFELELQLILSGDVQQLPAAVKPLTSKEALPTSSQVILHALCKCLLVFRAVIDYVCFEVEILHDGCRVTSTSKQAYFLVSVDRAYKAYCIALPPW